MNPYIERMIIEADELHTKIKRLDRFIYDGISPFRKIPWKKKRLLKKQLKRMMQYESILNKRIQLESRI